MEEGEDHSPGGSPRLEAERPLARCESRFAPHWAGHILTPDLLGSKEQNHIVKGLEGTFRNYLTHPS